MQIRNMIYSLVGFFLVVEGIFLMYDSGFFYYPGGVYRCNPPEAITAMPCNLVYVYPNFEYWFGVANCVIGVMILALVYWDTLNNMKLQGRSSEILKTVTY